LRSHFVAVRTTLFIAAISSASAATPDPSRFRWQVIGIKDGDTLSVNLPGLPPSLNPIAVRLRNVDAPESGGRAKCASERQLAERATRFTREAIAAAKTIEFEQPRWDKYGGRVDANVWVDDQLLSEQLIAAGLARPYDGGKRAGWCG
jgi:endonuclease YncB( thermonuclease family)